MVGAKPTANLMKALLPIELVRRVDPSDSLSASTVLMLFYIMQYPDKTIKEFEKMTELTKSATTRNILILTERGDRARNRVGLGLVETYEDNQDARVKRVRLTAKGTRLKADILKIMET